MKYRNCGADLWARTPAVFRPRASRYLRRFILLRQELEFTRHTYSHPSKYCQSVEYLSTYFPKWAYAHAVAPMRPPCRFVRISPRRLESSCQQTACIFLLIGYSSGARLCAPAGDLAQAAFPIRRRMSPQNGSPTRLPEAIALHSPRARRSMTRPLPPAICRAAIFTFFFDVQRSALLRGPGIAARHATEIQRRRLIPAGG